MLRCGLRRLPAVADSEGLILPVNKPQGWTSFDVVNKLRATLRWQAVGHAGTLDPPATGLLLVLCGKATKRQQEFMSLRKSYRAVIRFGVTTTTDDLAGDIVESHAVANLGEQDILQALHPFQGEIMQTPPAVSAIKIAGKRSYKIARSGKTPELTARPVKIYAMHVAQWQSPELTVTIECSAGTYIRSIARDLGRALGWGGALASLVRTAIGPYRIEHAFPLTTLLERPEFRGPQYYDRNG